MTATQTPSVSTAQDADTRSANGQQPGPEQAVDEFIMHTSKRHPAVWVALTGAGLGSLLISPWLIVPLVLLAIEQLGYSFSVTTRQIIERRGMFWRRTRRLPLNKLSSIDLVNRDFGLLFQVGTLTVTTHEGEAQSFRWVAQPERLIRLLDHQHDGDDLSSDSESVHGVRRLRNSLRHLV